MLIAPCLHDLYSTLGRDLTSIFLGPTLLAGLVPAVQLLDSTTHTAEAEPTLSTDPAVAAKATFEGTGRSLFLVILCKQLELLLKHSVVHFPKREVNVALCASQQAHSSTYLGRGLQRVRLSCFLLWRSLRCNTARHIEIDAISVCLCP